MNRQTDKPGHGENCTSDNKEDSCGYYIIIETDKENNKKQKMIPPGSEKGATFIKDRQRNL